MRSLILEILFPPQCAACGELLTPNVTKNVASPLCAECREGWERERVAECPNCFQMLSKCRCVSGLMKKAGISCHVKLMSYGEGDAHSVTRRVIATIKKRGANRAFRYLAEELKPGVFALRDAKNESGTKPETVISFLPRSAEARRKIGYDQAERLAKALAKSASLPYQPLFTRQRNGLAQKMLRRSERVENVRGAFALRQEVYGKRVVLVDDLVTTGAGMAEAAKLLYRADAADVIAVSIALTEKKKGKEDYFSR